MQFCFIHNFVHNLLITSNLKGNSLKILCQISWCKLKYVGMKPVINMKDLYSENSKTLLNEINQALTNEILG